MAGFTLVLNPKDARIETIQIHGIGSESSVYRDALPLELEWSMTRPQVEALLGKPSRFGGGDRNPLTFGVVPEWIRYDSINRSIHLEFGMNDKGVQFISMLTLMT